jgi:adenylate cyclase
MAVVVERSGVVTGVTLPEAWRAISDTNSLNRAAGMAQVAFSENASGSAARLLGRTRLAGMNVRYEELPFEWEQNRRLASRRDMLDGPIRTLMTSFEIAEAEGGVRVTVRLEIDLRWGLLAPVLRFQGGSSAQNLVDTIARTLREGRIAAPVTLDEEAYARAAAALKTERDAVHAERILSYVRSADDLSLARIRPYVLADAWGVDRTDVLVSCLLAVQSGLLDLRWEVVCPGCVNPSQRFPTLSDLGAEGRCHVCDLAFVLDFDRAVEATFTPNPTVRRVEQGAWCSGGPARYPHAHAQSILPAAGRARLSVPMSPGRYRLFVRGTLGQDVDIAEGAPSELVIAAQPGTSEPSIESRALSEGAPLRVAPGGLLLVENLDGERSAHARIEFIPSREDAASARDVTALDAFRTRFSAETLRPGIALHVARVALLFSDLAASTELYARLGDAAAYRLVADHFEMMRAAIVRQRGTVVKTIGDAVMAAFRDEEAALAAALHALAAMETFRAQSDDRAGTHVKLGVFSGPCFAICANGVVDYFGQTVNVAARMQGVAGYAEIAVRASLADSALAPEGWMLQLSDPEEVQLRGVAERMSIRRIRLTRAPW